MLCGLFASPLTIKMKETSEIWQIMTSSSNVGLSCRRFVTKGFGKGDGPSHSNQTGGS